MFRNDRDGEGRGSLDQRVHISNRFGYVAFYHRDAKMLPGSQKVVVCRGTEERSKWQKQCAKLEMGDALTNGIVTSWDVLPVKPRSNNTLPRRQLNKKRSKERGNEHSINVGPAPHKKIPVSLGHHGCVDNDVGLAQVKPECPVPLVKSPDVVLFYGKMTCPIVGHIGNVKLAIPRHYYFGPFVAYKGVDIWNAESYKNRPKHPTLDTEIDNFAIRIRLNNFRPIESRKDMEDFDKIGKIGGLKQPPEN